MPLTDVEKYYVKKNFNGLMKLGVLSPQDAMEMALDHEQPLFGSRLKLGQGGPGSIGKGGYGGNTTQGEGTEGVGSR